MVSVKYTGYLSAQIVKNWEFIYYGRTPMGTYPEHYGIANINLLLLIICWYRSSIVYRSALFYTEYVNLFCVTAAAHLASISFRDLRSQKSIIGFKCHHILIFKSACMSCFVGVHCVCMCVCILCECVLCY